MSFRTLATPEPLLKRGHYIEFIGDWGDKFEKRFYEVKHLIQFERSYRHGYLSDAVTTPLTIDPDADMGFEPTYYDTIYQVRIGLNAGWNMYVEWPTGDYRGKLEDPLFAVINPVATDSLKFIGVVSSARPSMAYAAGGITTLTGVALTNGPVVPYDQVLWLTRVEISNHVTTDVRIVCYDSFTDTDGTAQAIQLFDYPLVAGQTIGVDVERSKKALNQLQFQATTGTPTAGNPVVVYVGGELEWPKLDRFFEFCFVKDWMPNFRASVNSLLDFEKIIYCCLVNKLKIKAIEDQTIRAKLARGDLPVFPMFHYSEYESRAM